MQQRVFITGMGAYTAYGQGVDALWQGLLNQQPVIAAIPEQWKINQAYRSNVYVRLPAFDAAGYGYKKIDLVRHDPVSLIAQVSAAEALRQAAYEPLVNNSIDADRCGVFMGTAMGGITSAVAHAYYHFRNNLSDRSSDAISDMSESNRLIIPRYMPNAIAASIAIQYGFRGPVKTNCQACASGTIAIGEAYRAVQSGMIDCAVAGGAEMLGDQLGVCFHAFDRLNMLAKQDDPLEKSCKPFDAQRDGFLLAEGGAAVCVLESEASLKKRQQAGFPVRALAEIVAYAESFDAYHLVMPDPQGAGVVRLIQQGLAEAQIRAEDIQYINAHGTGTPQNDAMESQVIVELLGEKVVVNSTKGWIGHSLGASGAIGAIVTAQSLLDQKVHANANLKEPIASFVLPADTYSLECRYAITQSFALGGHNAALILKTYEA